MAATINYVILSRRQLFRQYKLKTNTPEVNNDFKRSLVFEFSRIYPPVFTFPYSSDGTARNFRGKYFSTVVVLDVRLYNLPTYICVCVRVFLRRENDKKR